MVGPRTPTSKWIKQTMDDQVFSILNPDHPEINSLIMDDIDSGIDVYYDQRWHETKLFCRYLLSNPQCLSGRSILVLGAGMGMESLVAGRLGGRVYLNDYSKVALMLNAMQLKKNGITTVELLAGRYEAIALPDVDIAIGCFLVYDTDTLSSMRTFIAHRPHELILMNGSMPAFDELCASTPRRTEVLVTGDGCRCVHFAAP